MKRRASDERAEGLKAFANAMCSVWEEAAKNGRPHTIREMFMAAFESGRESVRIIPLPKLPKKTGPIVISARR